MFTIDITDRVTPTLERAAVTLRSGEIEGAMEGALRLRVLNHLVNYSATHPNKMGGKRTQWIALAGESAHSESRPGTIEVSVSDPTGAFEHFLTGGQVPAGGPGEKLLTIPATPEAYGKRASEFHNLRFSFIHGPNTVGALVGPGVSSTGIELGRKHKGQRKFKATSSGVDYNKVFFWLARSVNQVGHPDLLPTSDQLIDTALEAAEEYLDHKEGKGGVDA